MGVRVLVIVAFVAFVSTAMARDLSPRIDSRVHDGEVCWDPDVEFPVPCDDDDD
ncbi:MAG: hypothetical protein QM780_05870 [Hyphomicrobium sp.]|uniref:hypothetical protein n=1 Tax=Hyphomicrobium sp. TaxID=82 RepID=UPI0039E28AD0